jgi:D-cysteine desulfhydrase
MSSDSATQAIPLGTVPTPLEPAPRLAQRLGLRPDDLWIKRDDLFGIGGGGNKIRKLAHAAAAAIDSSTDMLITTGAAQSNHARSTAAVAARLGMRCTLALAGTPPTPASGNLTLDRLFGAQVRWVGDVDEAGLATAAEQLAADHERAGGRPYVVPFGGSDAVGARGYIECAGEIVAQLPGVVTVVVAVGSGGTMAGLVAWLDGARVLGVDTGAVPDAAARVRGLVTALGVETGPLRLRTDQVGSGYAALTDAARRAMFDAATTEGLILEPVYTAKALAGLRAAVEEGDVRPGERTVFLHTGGLPGLFGHPVAGELAAELLAP